MRRTPALIVGGGPAGTAAAIVLARAGAPHLLVERTRETGDALCGGFLSWRTLAALESLGVARAALNTDSITILRLFHGTAHAEAALPAPAKGVSRRHLDTLLLARAAADGAAIERGVAVRGIEGDTVRIEGETIATDALLLATGKHDVRGLPRGAAGDDPAIGLRVRLPAHPALTRLVGEAIELHLFAGGYAGLNRQEDGGANLCLAVRRSRLHAAGSPAALLQAIGAECPMLGERLAFLDGGAIDAVANVPYGWRATVGTPGLWRVGDQAAVIPSLAGEGMGIALASGASAALALLRDGPSGAARWQERFARQARRPLGVAGLIRAMAERRSTARTLVSMAGVAPVLSSLAARLTRIEHPILKRGSAVPKSGIMEKMTLSDAEWQERLTPVQYHVLREAGTERAFSGALNGNKADGLYRCAACGLDLFDSADKYDSGSGWPSFTQPIAADAVSDHKDVSHGMTRIESRCARCDSHLGHVFPDGPPPTGQRYCMNSISLDFVARADV